MTNDKTRRTASISRATRKAHSEVSLSDRKSGAKARFNRAVRRETRRFLAAR